MTLDDRVLRGASDLCRGAEACRRALAVLPARAGKDRFRADARYFAGQLAHAALFTGMKFAIGARRLAPLWRLLDGLTEADWTAASDMVATQIAFADYCPNWWPAATQLLIRRVSLDVTAGAVSADLRARRRPTPHPPLPELTVSTPGFRDTRSTYRSGLFLTLPRASAKTGQRCAGRASPATSPSEQRGAAQAEDRAEYPPNSTEIDASPRESSPRDRSPIGHGRRRTSPYKTTPPDIPRRVCPAQAGLDSIRRHGRTRLTAFS